MYKKIIGVKSVLMGTHWKSPSFQDEKGEPIEEDVDWNKIDLFCLKGSQLTHIAFPQMIPDPSVPKPKPYYDHGLDGIFTFDNPVTCEIDEEDGRMACGIKIKDVPSGTWYGGE